MTLRPGGVSALILATAIAVSGCQTRRTSLIMAGIGGGAALLGGYVTYDARNDDEGPPIIFPLGLLVGGIVFVASVVQAIALGPDDAGNKPNVAPDPAAPPTGPRTTTLPLVTLDGMQSLRPRLRLLRAPPCVYGR